MKMKYIVIASLLFMVSSVAQARLGLLETAPHYVPCKLMTSDHPTFKDKDPSVFCMWIESNIVRIYDDRTGRYNTTFNGISFGCTNRGVCIGHNPHGGYKAGTVQGISNGWMNIYFYVDTSSDGRVMAYRIDQGPRAGKPRVTYLEAASHLVEVYHDNGVTEPIIEDKLNDLYQSGAEGYYSEIADIAFSKEMENNSRIWPWTRIEDVSCSATYPNQCYINYDIAVYRKDLTKHVKTIHPDVAAAKYGLCENGICIDGDHNFLGLDKTVFE